MKNSSELISFFVKKIIKKGTLATLGQVMFFCVFWEIFKGTYIFQNIYERLL